MFEQQVLSQARKQVELAVETKNADLKSIYDGALARWLRMRPILLALGLDPGPAPHPSKAYHAEIDDQQTPKTWWGPDLVADPYVEPVEPAPSPQRNVDFGQLLPDGRYQAGPRDTVTLGAIVEGPDGRNYKKFITGRPGMINYSQTYVPV